jgi:hypothetical protein
MILPCAIVGDNVTPQVPVLPFVTISVNGKPIHGSPIIFIEGQQLQLISKVYHSREGQKGNVCYQRMFVCLSLHHYDISMTHLLRWLFYYINNQ